MEHPNTEKSNLVTSLNQLLNDRQAAEIIGISPASLRKSRCVGLLLGITPPKHLKINTNVRYRRESIFSWLDSLEQYSIQPTSMEH